MATARGGPGASAPHDGVAVDTPDTTVPPVDRSGDDGPEVSVGPVGPDGRVGRFCGEHGVCRPPTSDRPDATIPVFDEGCVPAGIPDCAEALPDADGTCRPRPGRCDGDGVSPVPSAGCTSVDGSGGRGGGIKGTERGRANGVIRCARAAGRSPMGRQDDPSFEEMMAEEGVRPLGGDSPPPRATPSAPEPRAETSPQPSPTPPEPPAAVREEIERLRSQAALLEGRLEVAERDKQEIAARLAETEEARDAAAAERDALDKERRALQRKLTEEAPPPPPSSRPLADMLSERGLEGDEASDVLTGAALHGWLGDLIDGLRVEDPRAMAALLTERVSLICDAERCRPAAGSVAVHVSPERCEVCGGSDVQAALAGFLVACKRAGVKRVRVVGGSPTYHTVIRELHGDPGVDLKLIPGHKRRTARQAKADLRHADRVILWGATLLDHSISDLYDRSDPRVLSIPHRGIVTMFERAAEAVAGG
ncbi:MAG: hypothetical protein ACQEXJ_19325 [Myxococcota bacterium]